VLALAGEEPVLEGCKSASDVVLLVRWDGCRPSAVGANVLSALLRRASGPLAARILLQALLPRIRAERVVLPKYGHGVGERWQSPQDTVGDLVAECYCAITRHAGEDHQDVARLVLQEAARKLRTARQRQRRYQQRTVRLEPADLRGPTADLWAARSSAEWLAGAVVEAVRSGRLADHQARLIYATRVEGLPASEAGRREGLPPKAVYYALAKAEQQLLTERVA
jgi:DNA-directed RNA polymerase specialized sigma24 family protein